MKTPSAVSPLCIIMNMQFGPSKIDMLEATSWYNAEG